MTTDHQLGTIEKVSIREVWPTEDNHFTPWLGENENLERLGEELGMDLEVVETEADVGTFRLDVRARDVNTKREVVIENQYGDTDHSHLGQLLTYAGGFDAQAVVWIAESFRDEHRQALDFLNLRTGENTHFFGVEIELWKIGNSHPAPHFKLVATPNEWRKQTVGGGQAPVRVSERGERYRRFNQKLVDSLRKEHNFTKARVGQPYNWGSFASGVGGIGYNTSFAQGGKARVEVYIDTGDKNSNQRLFDSLKESKSTIEAELRDPLVWERLDNRRACRISVVRPGTIDDADDTLEEIHDWMIDRLLKFKQVFGPRLNELAK